ncbi:hypothetical protein NOR53_2593 [gamma proteobacterium NOR5-3]|nr:hypothetical protein NOR53_2593 [gamma proteobacterium NOR5-3]
MDYVSLEVAGSRLNGLIYRAAGPGPHPGVVLLHGYPGNEKNLDLAQSLRRAGFNVLFFHYRGAWGSEGMFSLLNAIEDVAAAVERLRTDPAMNTDPKRVSVVGHSMGGFLTLHHVARDPEVRCAVPLAFANMGGYVRMAAGNTELMALVKDSLSRRPPPLTWADGYSVFSEVRDNADALDLRGRVAALAARRMLVLSALHDEVVDYDMNHRALMAALREQGAPNVDELTIDSDHVFSAHRLTLIDHVVPWMMANCR